MPTVFACSQLDHNCKSLTVYCGPFLHHPHLSLVPCRHDVHVIDAWDPSNSGSTVPGVTYHKYDMLTVEPGWVDVVADADAIVHLACQ